MPNSTIKIVVSSKTLFQLSLIFHVMSIMCARLGDLLCVAVCQLPSCTVFTPRHTPVYIYYFVGAFLAVAVMSFVMRHGKPNVLQYR